MINNMDDHHVVVSSSSVEADGPVQLRRQVDQNHPDAQANGNYSFTRTDHENSLWTKFLAFIGAHEFLSPEMWRAALTESIATTCLIFSLTCSIISCLDSHEADPKLLVPFAVFIIAFLFLIVTVPLTGGHMSPVFTFISALKGVITLSRAFVYVLAQCVGSLTGFLVIKAVMDKNAAEQYFLGGCSITGHGGATALGPSTALVLEFACTFVVLFVGVTVALDERRGKELGLVMVCAIVAGSMGLAVFVSITVTGRAGYAGVGLNPARCLGPALLIGGELWDGHWVFWVGPFLACSLYYGIAMSLPKEGLSLVDGGEYEYDIVKLTWACFRGSKRFPNLPRQN